MKPRFSSLRELVAPILACAAVVYCIPSVWAATHLADGVTLSGGYYDVHKGYDGRDENMCWAAVSSNVIQYWQDYYGVFYQGTAALPNGRSSYNGPGVEYGKRYLQVFEEFRNNWTNDGGNAFYAWNWWLLGEGYEGGAGFSVKTGANPGGYFQDYFAPGTVNFGAVNFYEVEPTATLAQFGQNVKSAFNSTAGQVCDLGISAADSAEYAGHALTCYGYETDVAGNVTGLYLCNSDDRSTRLFLCDVKKTAQGLVLVDHATGANWSYAGFSLWVIDELASIRTPQILQNMLATYTTSDLVWNGSGKVWSVPATTRGKLPTESSGWEASAGEGANNVFASFYADGRNVVFNGGGSETVTLQGTLTPSSVLVDTGKRNYSFTGSGHIAGETTHLTVRGDGKLSIETSNTYGGGTTLLGGELTVKNSQALGSGNVLLQGGTLNLFGNGTLGDLSIGGDLSVNSGKIAFDLSAGNLADNIAVAGAMNLDSATFQFNWTGGDVKAGMWALADYGTSRIGTLSTEAAFLNSTGYSLTYSSIGNTLYAIVSNSEDLTTLQWKDGAELWTLSGGTLQWTTWHNGQEITISGYKVVDLQETVTPLRTIIDTVETTTLEGTGHIAGAGALIKRGGGNLVMEAVNTYTGGTRIESGTVTLQHADALGRGVVIIAYGKLDLSSLSLGNNITIHGTASLDNAAHYAGTLTLEQGVLSGNERMQAGAYRMREGTASISLGGEFASLTKTGDGKLLLSGDNTYGGGTALRGGYLEAGSTTALGKGEVRLEGGTLDAGRFALSNEVCVTTGANYLLRAGQYRGNLRIDGGSLDFFENGQQAIPARAGSLVMHGGRMNLAGNGDSTPALTLAGNATITGGMIGMNIAAETGETPLLDVGGTWSISGAEILFGVDAKNASASLTEGRHIFVLVEGTTGTWGENALSFTQTCAKYFGPDNVSVYESNNQLLMDVTATVRRFYTNESVFPNLQAPARIGGALLDEALLRSNPQLKQPESELAHVMNAIDLMANEGRPGEAAPVMAALAGNTTTALTAALAQSAYGQLRSIRNHIPDDWSYADVEDAGSSFWMEANSSFASLSAQNEAAGYTNSAWGGTVGCDTQASSGLFLGAALSVQSGKLTADACDQATGHLDTCTLSLYGQSRIARWTHTAILAGGLANANLDRTVAYDGGRYGTSGSTNGSTLSAGYEIAFEAVQPDEDSPASFAPLASLSVSSVRLSDYTETGAGNAGLRVSGMERTFGTAGLGFRSSLPIGSNLFNREAFLSLRMAVLQDIGSRRGISEVTLDGANGPSHRQKGADVGSTGFEAGLGMTIPLEAQSSLFVDVQADFRAHQSSVQGTVGYRYFF